jgi:uncharacterized protein YaaQ
MALASFAGLANYDMVGVREDLSDVVSEILLGDQSLLARIGIGGEATNVKHEWLERSLNAITVADSGGALTSGATTLTVVTGQGTRLRIGTLLRDTAQGKTEVIQVTAISSDTITIVRGYGSTTGEAHAASATFRIIGRPKQSGEDVSVDRSTVRTRRNNYCQIFEDAVIIAGDAEAVLKAGVPSEVALQAADRMIELMRELDNSIIMGVVNEAAPSDTVYRSMGGVIEFLTLANGNSNSTNEATSEQVINDMYRQAYNDGGNPNLLVVNQSQMKVISTFNADKIRIAPGVNMAGVFVTKFMTDLGQELDILLDRWMPDDTAVLLDTSRLMVVPLTSRSFGMKVIAPTGDAEKRQILGDYTIEIRNPLEAHAIHTNLAIPS